MHAERLKRIVPILPDRALPAEQYARLPDLPDGYDSAGLQLILPFAGVEVRCILAATRESIDSASGVAAKPSMWSKERFSIIRTTMCFRLSNLAGIDTPAQL